MSADFEICILGILGGYCVHVIENAVSAICGVADAKISESNVLRIRFSDDHEADTVALVVASVEAVGYRVESISCPKLHIIKIPGLSLQEASSIGKYMSDNIAIHSAFLLLDRRKISLLLNQNESIENVLHRFRTMGLDAHTSSMNRQILLHYPQMVSYVT